MHHAFLSILNLFCELFQVHHSTQRIFVFCSLFDHFPTIIMFSIYGVFLCSTLINTPVRYDPGARFFVHIMHILRRNACFCICWAHFITKVYIWPMWPIFRTNFTTFFLFKKFLKWEIHLINIVTLHIVQCCKCRITSKMLKENNQNKLLWIDSIFTFRYWLPTY